MADDRADEPRKLSAECLAKAQQTSDLNLRAPLLGMAQRWLDLAHGEFNPAELDVWNYYLIQTKIGHELKTYFELTQGVPRVIADLLVQVDANSGRKAPRAAFSPDGHFTPG
jgi:hypothetical protein